MFFSSEFFLLNSGFIILTCVFNLLTRVFNLLTRAFNLVTRGFCFQTSGFEFITRGFELVTCKFALVTCGFELVTRNWCFTFPRSQCPWNIYTLTTLNKTDKNHETMNTAPQTCQDESGLLKALNTDNKKNEKLAVQKTSTIVKRM